jgi:hypothetical protein
VRQCQECNLAKPHDQVPRDLKRALMWNLWKACLWMCFFVTNTEFVVKTQAVETDADACGCKGCRKLKQCRLLKHAQRFKGEILGDEICGVVSAAPINWVFTFHASYSVCATGRGVVYLETGWTGGTLPPRSGQPTHIHIHIHQACGQWRLGLMRYCWRGNAAAIGGALCVGVVTIYRGVCAIGGNLP